MTSQTLGDLLLQGWTMLNDACDSCNIPLMQNPYKTETLCVKCNRDFQKEGGLAGAVVEDEVMDIAPMPTEYERSKKQVEEDKLSDLIGKGLLAGETMLADHCKNCGCPLMRTKKAVVYCVKCSPIGGAVKKAVKAEVVEPVVAPIEKGIEMRATIEISGNDSILKMTVNCLALKLEVARDLLDAAIDANDILESCAAISAIVKAIEEVKSVL